MRDEIVAVGLVLSFAALVTAHVTLVFGLAMRRPRWQAPIALVVLPLAPWWGWARGLRRRAITWVVAAVLYAVLAWLASR
jgi:hypothetical protein